MHKVATPIRFFTLLVLTSLSNPVDASQTKKGPEIAPTTIGELDECVNCTTRFVVYDQKTLFSPKEDGAYASFELQERMDVLNREFEKRKIDLRDRSRTLKNQDVDASDPEQMGIALKEKSALEIDANLLQQEYQMRRNQIQVEFLQEVLAAIRELAEEFEWDLVIPIDPESSFFVVKIDATKKVLTRLNDKFRAKQRAKKFSDAAKKESNVIKKKPA